jgi:hypothetical protein
MLGIFVVVIGAVIAHFALRYHTATADETLAVNGARFMANFFPEGLWDTQAFSRGPERLTAIVLLFVNTVVSPTADEFVVGHVVIAFAWALIAVPTYGLARGVGLGAWPALAVAALAVFNPFAVYAVTFLNTTLGLLTFTTLFYFMWRTVVRPSPLADIGVVVAFLLTVVARVGHTPFVLALVPAVLVQRWRDRPPGQAFGRWLRELPFGVVRDHAVLVVVAALGVLLLMLKGDRSLLGGYGSDILGQHIDLVNLWAKVRTVTARVAEGVAFVPLLLALPWLVRELVRPGTREVGAFAVLVIATLPIFFYVFLYATVEDRYMAILVPPILVAFGCAFVQSRVSWVVVGVTGVLVARAVATVGLYPTDEPFSFFIAPGSQFFKRVVLNKLALVLPFGDVDKLTIALVLIVAVAVLLSLTPALHGQPRTGLLVTGFAGLFVYLSVSSVYTMHKFTLHAGAPSLTFSEQTYVDRVAGGEPVGLLSVNPAEDVFRGVSWQNASYFNGSLAMPVGRAVDAQTVLCCPRRPQAPVTIRIDERTGEVRAVTGEMPRLLLVPLGWLPYRLNGQHLVTGYDAHRMERLPPRVRVSYVALGGTYKDGWGRPGSTQRLRVFPGAQTGGKVACLAGTIAAPSLASGGQVRFRLRSAADRVVRRIPSGGQVRVRLTLADRRADRVSLSSGPTGVLPDGRESGVVLADAAVVPCDT